MLIKACFTKQTNLFPIFVPLLSHCFFQTAQQFRLTTISMIVHKPLVHFKYCLNVRKKCTITFVCLNSPLPCSHTGIMYFSAIQSFITHFTVHGFMLIPMETIRATGTAESLPCRNISVRQPQDFNRASSRALDVISTLLGGSDRAVIRLTSKILLVTSGTEHFPRTTQCIIPPISQTSPNSNLLKTFSTLGNFCKLPIQFIFIIFNEFNS